MLLRPRKLLYFTTLLLIIFSIVRITSQLRFERFLATIYITWDDLGKGFSDALIEAEAHGVQPSVPYSISTATYHIPPEIHYIWFKNLYNKHLDISTIPSEGSPSPRECQEANPDFQIHIWNASEARDLLETHYSWFLPVYDAYKHPIQRVDAFKYFLLYHHGGVYMDLDITCRRSIAPLLEYPAWFPEASPMGVNNDLKAARPKHPVLGLMNQRLAGRNYNLLFPYLTIFWSTGPKFTSDVLRSWWDKADKLYQTGTNKKDSDASNLFFILPRQFYSEKYTFFGHRPGGTWHGQDVVVVLWFVEKPYALWFLILTVVVGTASYLYRRRRRVLRVLTSKEHTVRKLV